MIMGPAQQTEGFNSGDIVKRIMRGEVDPVPNFSVGYVDVRDCAECHVKAVTVDAAKGHRVISDNKAYKRIDIVKILHDEFQAKGWNIPLNEAPDTGDKKTELDNSFSRDVLGVQYRPIEETMIEMANTMIDIGYI